MLGVVGEQLKGDALQGCLGRVDLGQNVDAVAVLLDHLLDPAHLPLDPPQSRFDLLLVFRIAWHISDYTHRGYSGRVDHHDMAAMSSPHQAMGHAGHEATPATVLDMRNRFLVAAVLSVPILLWSSIGRQVLHFGVPAPFGLRDDVFQLILSLPVIGYSGWIFFDGAVRALRARTLDMMVLVAVAIAAGWTYSVVITLRGSGDVFYEASTVLCAFVLLSHSLKMPA